VLRLTDKYPQLSRPPLREALVDIKLQNVLSAEWVKSLEQNGFEGFDSSQPIKESGFKFELPHVDKPAHAVVISDQTSGRRYDRNDGTRVLQVRRDGMTLSILKNYTNWEALKDAAHALWGRFLQISGPVHVGRLAVRYINAIEMIPGDDYDKYLTAAPRIADGLPQIVNNFIQRVEIPFLNEEAIAIITQTLGGPASDSSGKFSAIIDIDVFCWCSLEGTSDDVWLRLDNLRDIANRVFFSSITKRVLESYL
jgi:uncharacterized protein (TIGR04255 family)